VRQRRICGAQRRRRRARRALALIAPWLHDAALVREMYGGDEAVRQRIAAGEAARERYERTGIIDYVPAQSASDEVAAMPMAMDF
jgi:hypothetical protein